MNSPLKKLLFAASLAIGLSATAAAQSKLASPLTFTSTAVRDASLANLGLGTSNTPNFLSLSINSGQATITDTGIGQFTSISIPSGGTLVQGGHSINFGGNFTLSGSSALTLTTTGVSNATIPLGTHTLAPTDSPTFTGGVNLSSTDGTGYVGLPQQSTNAPTPASGYNLFVDPSGSLSMMDSGGFKAQLKIAAGTGLFSLHSITLDTDGSVPRTLNIGAGGTLGSAAFTASSAYDAAGAASAVNSAIPAKVWTYKQIDQLQNWWNGLARSATQRVTVMPWGDSYGFFKIGPNLDRLWRDYGFGGYIGTQFNYPSGGYGVTGGAAVVNTLQSQTPIAAGWANWPTGGYFTIPAGGTLARGGYCAAYPQYLWDTLKVWYKGDPSAGVFKIQTQALGGPLVDEAGYTAVDATVDTLWHCITITKGTKSQYLLNIVGVSGGTTTVQTGVLNSDSGVAVFDVTRGGNAMNDMVTWDPQLATLVLSDLHPALTIVEMNDDFGVNTPIAPFEALFTNAGISPRSDICYIGTWQGVDVSAVTGYNTALQAAATTYGRAYWDDSPLALSTALLRDNFATTITVSSLTSSGTTATVTCPAGVIAAAGLVSGHTLIVTGANESKFNGIFTITGATSTTLTYTLATSGTTTATGTLLVKGIDTGHLNAQAQSLFADQWARDMKIFGNQLGRSGATKTEATLNAQADLQIGGRSVETRLRSAAFGPKLTGGLNFDGSLTGYATAPAIGTGDFTVAFWMYVPANGSWGSGYRSLFSFGPSSGGGAGNGSFTVEQDTASDQLNLALKKTDGTGSLIRKIRGLAANWGGGWHLVTVRRIVNSASQLFVSVDAAKSTVPSTSGLDGAGGIFYNTTSGTPPTDFSGSITSTYFIAGYAVNQPGIYKQAEIAIWTSALTDDEIKSYYDTGVPPGTPAALYNLREGAGNIARDASGNGHDLYLSSSANWLNANRQNLQTSGNFQANALAERYGGFYATSGAQDRVTNTTAMTSVGTGPFAMACLVKLPSSISTWMGIFKTCDTNTNSYRAGGLACYFNNSASMNFRWYQATTSDYADAGVSMTPYLGQWVLIGVRRDASGNITYSANNRPLAVSKSTAGSGVDPSTVSVHTEFVTFGGSQNSFSTSRPTFGAGWFYAADFDPMTIFTTGGGSPTVMYGFNDGVGTFAQDWSGNGNNGTYYDPISFVKPLGSGRLATTNTTSTITFAAGNINETITNTSASTIASATITLPSTSTPGVVKRYVTHGALTSVSVSGTVAAGAALTTLAADSAVAWESTTTSGTWVRIQ